jgi:hypothetical protein
MLIVEVAVTYNAAEAGLARSMKAGIAATTANLHFRLKFPFVGCVLIVCLLAV